MIQKRIFEFAKNLREQSKLDHTEVYPPQTDSTNEDGVEKIEHCKRYSIQYLVERWTKGEKKPLNNLLKGFKLIRELPETHEYSFTKIAGFHGQPFDRSDSWAEDGEGWGGYCPHASVLFPVWHRAYVNYLERALQSVLPDSGVMMAYWDELDDTTSNGGVPPIFQALKVWIDDKPEDNPLGAFTFNMKILTDKPVLPTSEKYENVDYTTVRYPLEHTNIGSDKRKDDANKHNSEFFIPGKDTNQNGRRSAVDVLDKNVRVLLFGPEAKDGKDATRGRQQTSLTTAEKYTAALSVETYTVFSNKNSVRPHNRTVTTQHSWSLEDPHDDVHGAVGAVPAPGTNGPWGAGDMAFVDTAAYDPIFYFHHAFVDFIFWRWQEKHDATKELIVAEDDEGAVLHLTRRPGQTSRQKVNMDTELTPFKHPETQKPLTGRDVTDLTELKIEYVGSPEPQSDDVNPVFGPAITTRSFEIGVHGSVVQPAPFTEPPSEPPVEVAKTAAMVSAGVARRKIVVSNVDRVLFSGPFVVVVHLVLGDERYCVGYETVFNRLSLRSCGNCMANRYMEFVFDLSRVDSNVVNNENTVIDVEVQGQRAEGGGLIGVHGRVHLERSLRVGLLITTNTSLSARSSKGVNARHNIKSVAA